MKRKHIAAISVALICTIVAIALAVLSLILFLESANFDPSDQSNEGPLTAFAGVIALIAMFEVSVRLNAIGAINSLMALFLAASLVHKYSKKIDILCFSVIGVDSVAVLFFIVVLAVFLN